MTLLGFLLISYAVLQYSTATPSAPTCLDETYELPPPAPVDCIEAMAEIRNFPHYTIPQVFGTYEDPPRNVPIGWRYKSCWLKIDVDDGSKTDRFALSSVIPAFAAVEKLCLIGKPGRRLGGYVPIGHGGSFYAILQADPDYRPSILSSHLYNASNDSTATSAEGSQSSVAVDTA